MVTHSTTIVFLYHHPGDSRTIGRNMLLKIFSIKGHHKTEVHLLVVYTFYKCN